MDGKKLYLLVFVVPCAVCSLAWCAHCAVRSTPSTPTQPTHPGTNSLSLLRQEKCISSVEWGTNPQTEPGVPTAQAQAQMSNLLCQQACGVISTCDPSYLSLLDLQQCCWGGGCCFLEPFPQLLPSGVREEPCNSWLPVC